MKRWAIAAILLCAGCNSSGPAADDPVAKLFEDHYPDFISAAGAHRAGCEVELKAKGEAGTKRDDLTTTVDVDALGNFRITRDDGSELVRVGLHAWTKPRDGKLEKVEAGSRPDLERDAAVAEWRSVLEPMRDHLKLKHTGSKKLGNRSLDTWDLTLEPGGKGEDAAPKPEKGAGKIETDVDTGFPVRVELTASWTATPPGGGGRVHYELEKMVCTVSDLGNVKPIEAPDAAGADKAEPAPSPSAKPTVTAAKSGKKTR